MRFLLKIVCNVRAWGLFSGAMYNCTFAHHERKLADRRAAATNAAGPTDVPKSGALIAAPSPSSAADREVMATDYGTCCPTVKPSGKGTNGSNGSLTKQDSS